MVRSFVKTKTGPCVSLYMVMIREYLQMSLLPGNEKELKDAIKKAGGSINQSGLFLATTSNRTVVNKATGINRRSVAFVPRQKVPKDILKELDKCKSPVMHTIYIVISWLVCNYTSESSKKQDPTRGELYRHINNAV